MSKKNIIGILVSLFGLMMMGYEMGRSAKIGESNQLLHYGGLFIVFLGAFIAVTFNKNKVNKH